MSERTTLLDLLTQAAAGNLPDAWGPEQHPIDPNDIDVLRKALREVLEESGVDPDQ